MRYESIMNNVGYFSDRTLDGYDPFHSDFKSGGKDKDYRDVIAAGLDATHDYTRVITSDDIIPGFGQISYCGWDGNTGKPDPGIQWLETTYGRLVRPPGTQYTGSGIATADAQALHFFWNSVNAAHSSIQGGVVVGEIRETLRTIAHPMRSLGQGLDHYLRGIPHKCAKSVRGVRGRGRRKSVIQSTIADTWLENSFALQPLYNDMVAGAKALSDIINGPWRPPVKRVSGRGVSPFDMGTVYRTTSSDAWSLLRVSHTRFTEKCTVHYFGGVKLKPYSTASGLARDLGFSLGSFVPTLYELLPYSWLVDYVTNFNDIVTAATGVDSNLYFCGRTIVVEARGRTWCDDYPRQHIDRLRYVMGNAGSAYSMQKTINRSKITSLQELVPSFQFRIPNLFQGLNVAALIGASGDTSRRIARL